MPEIVGPQGLSFRGAQEIDHQCQAIAFVAVFTAAQQRQMLLDELDARAALGKSLHQAAQVVEVTR
jgi:hypothetical protein